MGCNHSISKTKNYEENNRMNSSHIIDQNYDPSLQRELISSLEHCGISQQDKKFYMLHPDVWDWNIPDNSQLNDRVKAILSTSTYSSPLWIESDQQQEMFRKLKIKYRAIERAEKSSLTMLIKPATMRISSSLSSSYKQMKLLTVPQRV